jgi:molybdopterin synthase catalytic subunit
VTVRLQREDFDVGAEIARLSQGRTDVGAVASFTGICRGTDGAGGIAAMTLEHYPGMAEPRSSAMLPRPRSAGRCSA